MNFNKERAKELTKAVWYIVFHTIWMSIIAFIVVLIFARCNPILNPAIEEDPVVIEADTSNLKGEVTYIDPPVTEESDKQPEKERIVMTRVITLTKTRTYYDVPLDRDLQDHIIDTCEEYGIDPAIVIAMIRKESQFTPGAVGDGGNSLGLMQIQPRYHSAMMLAHRILLSLLCMILPLQSQASAFWKPIDFLLSPQDQYQV